MINEHCLSKTTVGEINQLIDRVERDLLNPINVSYFDINPQQPHKDQLIGNNAERLRQVLNMPGVYAIWVKEGPTPAVRYIGHTAGSTARTRLRNHFFKKDPRTGSQLINVEAAVANGHKVGFTYVALDPPFIRLYVEASLIDRNQLTCVWNRQGKATKGRFIVTAGLDLG